MSSAIKTDLRNEVVRVLKGVLTFEVQPDDTGRTIVEDAVQFQKVNAKTGRSNEKTNQMMDFPGLLVSAPRRTVIPPSEGDNERDLWHYQILIQLVDMDQWDVENRVASWDKWIEQIASYFNFQCFGMEELATKTVFALCTANEVSDIDEKMWVKHSEFIAGIMLEVRVLQHRGVIAQ